MEIALPPILRSSLLSRLFVFRGMLYQDTTNQSKYKCTKRQHIEDKETSVDAAMDTQQIITYQST